MILSLILAAVMLLGSEDNAGEVCTVIPVEFSDLKFSVQADEIQGLVDDSESYLKRQLPESRKIEFRVAGTVSLSRPYAYYGANSVSRKDERVAEAVIESCRILNPDTDFSGIDYLIFVMAGPNESYGAGEDYFWPQQPKLSDYNLSLILDGRKFDDFAVCTELGPDGRISGIGDFCHEFGHFLGLRDLYDTDGDGSGGTAPGLQGLSIMDTGNRNGDGHTPPDFCSVEYDQLGYGDSTVLRKGAFRLEPSSCSGKYAVLPSGSTGIYHLVENRGGDNLFIVRIDRSNGFAGYSDHRRKNLTAAERWEMNEVNCRPDHQCAELVKASAAGSFCGDSLSLIGIRKDGCDFVFNVIEAIVIKEIRTFQDGALVTWCSEISPSGIEDAGLAWWKDEGDIAEQVLTPTAGGSYICSIEGLQPNTRYRISFHITTKDGQSFQRTATMLTEAYREGAIPFIMTDSDGRRDDGTYLPGSRLRLRVRNAPDAEGINWTFNGGRIFPDAEGLWAIPGTGTLKATLVRNDGSKDIIEKKIIVR